MSKELSKNHSTDLYNHSKFIHNLPLLFRYHQWNDLIKEDVDEISHKWSRFISKVNREHARKNLEKDRDRFIYYGWLNEDGSIKWPEYILNQYGMRTSLSYKNGTSIALGCSDTFGLGNHEKDVWVTKLSEEINKPIINLGVCGAGLDTCYRLLKSYLEDYTPEMVFLLIPSPSRYEILYRSVEHGLKHINILPNSDWLNGEDKQIWETFNKTLFIEENMYLNFHKNLDAIRYLCMSKNIPLYEELNPGMYDPDKILEQSPIHINIDSSPSLDFQHMGPEYQELILNIFLKKINEDN
jgi:hypothetical protein